MATRKTKKGETKIEALAPAHTDEQSTTTSTASSEALPEAPATIPPRKEPTMEEKKRNLRVLTKSLYDLQKLRVSTGNRIAINFRTKLGQDPGEELTDNDGQEILKIIKMEWKRLTDGVVNLTPREVRAAVARNEGVINDEVEFRLVQSYMHLLNHEEEGFKSLAGTLKEFPIYTEYLTGIKGVGPAMAAVIISELDPHKAHRISGFWKFGGLDVAEDGKGRSRRKEHLVEVEYTNRDGQLAKKLSITFNPFLKTKLVGVLGSSFLRSASPYADVYKGYKFRLENHPNHKEKTKGHRHNMAMRYMIKIFLQDLWLKWREMEGLEVTAPYAEAKLGMVHGM